MRSRMARKSHRGTATSAIWKITYRACVTALAPILINFSLSVVIFQQLHRHTQIVGLLWIDVAGVRLRKGMVAEFSDDAVEGLTVKDQEGRLEAEAAMNMWRYPTAWGGERLTDFRPGSATASSVRIAHGRCSAACPGGPVPARRIRATRSAG